MITAEIKINGTLLGHLYAYNTGIKSELDTDVYRYNYEYYKVGEGKVTIGSITHSRADGAEKLISLLMGEI